MNNIKPNPFGTDPNMWKLKDYLNLLEQYKDEFQFAETTLLDLRKEREIFYAEKLGKIAATLQEMEVISPEIQQKWLEEIKNNYMQSLNFSERIVMDSLSEILTKLKEIQGKYNQLIKY